MITFLLTMKEKASMIINRYSGKETSMAMYTQKELTTKSKPMSYEEMMKQLKE